VRGVTHSLTVWTRHTDSNELYFARPRANRSIATKNQGSDSLKTTTITTTVSPSSSPSSTVTEHKDIKQVEHSENDASAPANKRVDFIVTQSSQPYSPTAIHSGQMYKSVLSIARRWIDLARVVRIEIEQ
jgi:hypothetical protein